MSEVLTTTSTVTSDPASTIGISSPHGSETHRSSPPCPYAEALLLLSPASSEKTSNDTTSSSQRSNTNKSHVATGTDAITKEAVKACPAFSSGSCPFKNAHSSQEVRETLLKIPSSHFDSNAEFFQVIQGLHQVTAQKNSITNSNNNDSSEDATHTIASRHSNFQLPGGCPVQPLLKEYDFTNRTFAEAMEEFSLSAVMARLAQDVEDAREQQEEKDQKNALLAAQAAVLQERILEQQQERQAQGQPPKLQEEEDAEVVAVNDEGKSAVVTSDTTSTAASTTTSQLSSALKTGTAASHQAAENVHFVSNFIRGKIDRKLYAQLVIMLYHVYHHLEECLDEYGPKHFATCHFPVFLNRREALHEDLDYWWGHNNATSAKSPTPSPPMSDATRDYCDRIRHIAATQPLLLLAHAYTRYFGDLSGGRILARVARRALNLGKTEGLAFYEFTEISSPKRFKDEYRAALDALPLTSQQVQELVAEANVAFCLNMRLFEELDVQANVPGAAVRPLSDALAYATKASVLEENTTHDVGSNGALSADKCPFAKMGATAQAAATQTAATNTSKRCPWPFILLHDPIEALRDWQTWALLGLVLCWVWSVCMVK